MLTAPAACKRWLTPGFDLSNNVVVLKGLLTPFRCNCSFRARDIHWKAPGMELQTRKEISPGILERRWAAVKALRPALKLKELLFPAMHDRNSVCGLCVPARTAALALQEKRSKVAGRPAESTGAGLQDCSPFDSLIARSPRGN